MSRRPNFSIKIFTSGLELNISFGSMFSHFFFPGFTEECSNFKLASEHWKIFKPNYWANEIYNNCFLQCRCVELQNCKHSYMLHVACTLPGFHRVFLKVITWIVTIQWPPQPEQESDFGLPVLERRIIAYSDSVYG